MNILIKGSIRSHLTAFASCPYHHLPLLNYLLSPAVNAGQAMILGTKRYLTATRLCNTSTTSSMFSVAKYHMTRSSTRRERRYPTTMMMKTFISCVPSRNVGSQTAVTAIATGGLLNHHSFQHYRRQFYLSK